MEVTKQNFAEILEELDEVLQKCDFISIDCEFTGLGADNRIYSFDLPEDVYAKSNKESIDFIIIQMGLTAVTIDKIDSGDKMDKNDLDDKNDNNDLDDKNDDVKMANSNDIPEPKFTYRSYNFYICPRLWKVFRCQSNSMQFLAEKGFNFNKLFCNGIPYLNHPEAQVVKKKMTDVQMLRQKPRQCNHIPVPDKDKGFIDEINKLVEELLASDDEEKTVINNNGFQRRLVYELIEAKYHDKVVVSTSTVKNAKVMTIKKKKSSEEEKKIEEEKRLVELNDFKNNIGMTLILHKISNSRKLIVGHNVLMDLIYILKQFFIELPDTLNAFKKRINLLFPRIIDTKYMATDDKFESIKSTVLENLVDALSTKPYSLPDLTCETEHDQYSQPTDKYHEAGFDSYITAVAFLSLTKYLGSKFPKNFENDSVLEPFLNKVFLMNVEGLSYIDLVKREPIPHRDHVFHITCPEGWTEDDLTNRFKPYGSIYAKWVDSKNVIVSLHNRERAKEVLKAMKKSTEFKIETFAEYKKINLPTASPISISSSSASSSSSSSSSTESLSPISSNGNTLEGSKRKREDDTMDSNIENESGSPGNKKLKNNDDNAEKNDNKAEKNNDNKAEKNNDNKAEG